MNSPIVNQVDIPVEPIARAFQEAVDEELTGSKRIHIRLRPSAAECVEFTVETERYHRIDEPEPLTAREIGFPVDPIVMARERNRDVLEDPRRLAIVYCLEEKVAPRLKLGTPIVSVTGEFQKGMLRTVHVQDVK